MWISGRGQRLVSWIWIINEKNPDSRTINVTLVIRILKKRVVKKGQPGSIRTYFKTIVTTRTKPVEEVCSLKMDKKCYVEHVSHIYLL